MDEVCHKINRQGTLVNFFSQKKLQTILGAKDDSDIGYLIECDLEYSTQINEETENFPYCPIQNKVEINKSKYIK